jgi:hypothetical protein
VLLTVAERGDGVDQLVEAIGAHRAHLASGGELEPPPPPEPPRSGRSPADLRTEVGTGHGEALDILADQVAAGKLGPYTADQLLAGVGGQRRARPRGLRRGSTSGPTTTRRPPQGTTSGRLTQRSPGTRRHQRACHHHSVGTRPTSSGPDGVEQPPGRSRPPHHPRPGAVD